MNPKHLPSSATNRAACPVCHQAVYSKAGIHPQCAVRQSEPPRVKDKGVVTPVPTVSHLDVPTAIDGRAGSPSRRSPGGHRPQEGRPRAVVPAARGNPGRRPPGLADRLLNWIGSERTGRFQPLGLRAAVKRGASRPRSDDLR